MEEPIKLEDMIEQLEKMWCEAALASFEERVSIFTLIGLRLGLKPKHIVKCLKKIPLSNNFDQHNLIKVVHIMGLTIGEV